MYGAGKVLGERTVTLVHLCVLCYAVLHGAALRCAKPCYAVLYCTNDWGGQPCKQPQARSSTRASTEAEGEKNRGA
ncbi:hypothetical protein IAQ61_006235 [Plenodomus lingam]|uniref:uncharacterized protein n=1 Tax=Leptosphaeria maculans TaxID=5022 RepID=UPI00332FAA62|nr:hypothetical protein IAQ61_006235 [Plenodomus lingam]